MKTVCIVQARTGSSRFPSKVLADLCGRPMLSHVLERAAMIKSVDKVVLAVPTEDLPKLGHLWPHVLGGDERNVLARYEDAAWKYDADVVVRITGDCPLLAPELSSHAVAAFTQEMQLHGGYIAACQPYSPIPDGMDTEVFSASWLHEAHLKARASQRGHVVEWIREKKLVTPLNIPGHYKGIKWSVDTKEDLARVKLVMEYLNHPLDFSRAATFEAWQRAGRP